MLVTCQVQTSAANSCKLFTVWSGSTSRSLATSYVTDANGIIVAAMLVLADCENLTWPLNGDNVWPDEKVISMTHLLDPTSCIIFGFARRYETGCTRAALVVNGATMGHLASGLDGVWFANRFSGTLRMERQ